MKYLARSLALIASICLGMATVAFAQTYGGGSPGAGGTTPRLLGDQAWMGNASHQLRLDRARDNSIAIVGISRSSAVTSYLGAPIWIDLGQVFYIAGGVTGGTPGVPGSGTTSWTIPIPGPIDPSIAGVSFFAQAFINDYVGMTPAVTNGWIATLTLPPRVFVGTSVGGSADPYWLVDPITQTVKDSGGRLETDNVTSAIFTNGGTDLYIGSSIRSAIFHADLSGPAPVFSTLISFSGSGAYGLSHDAGRGLIWCMTDPYGSGRELTAVDVDKSRPTYGQIVSTTTGVGSLGYVERFGLSPDGKEAAILQVLGSALWLWDLDPSSPTYLQQKGLLSVPTSQASPLNLITLVAYTRGGLEIHCVIQHAGSIDGEVARYSRGTGVWIDHDPSTASTIDNIGPMSVPPISMGSAPASYEVSKWSDFSVAAGFGGSGWAGRLDWDPSDWSNFSWTPVNGTPTGTWAASLSFDEKALAVAIPSPPELQFYAMSSMGFAGSVPLPGAANIYTVVWQ